MTPNARSANKRKAESPAPDTGGDASTANTATTPALPPSRPHRKKQKQHADEAPSPAATSPVVPNRGVSPALSGMKKHMLSLLTELQTAADDTYGTPSSRASVCTLSWRC
jgi:hypothetical protein